MKIHLSLPVTDLKQSVSFYATLLDARPLKNYPDYALFVTEGPGLELALGPSQNVRIDPSAHFGLAVEDSATVDRAIARLSAAGLALDAERGETCCYAKQDKIWATDPDGRRWEVYHVLENTAERDDPHSTCCTADTCETFSTCCAT